MYFKKFLNLVILGYRPPHLFLFLGYIVFFISIENAYLSIKTTLRSLLLISAVIIPVSGGLMLINRASDIKEDRIKGRRNIFTLGEASQYEGILVSLFLYSVSLVFFLYLIIDENIFLLIPFLFFVILTWTYSDKEYIGKLLGFRLKDHYIGEFIAYIFTFPSFTLSIWLIFGELTTKTLVALISITMLGMFSLFVKDIKDVSSDKKAGLNTIASKLSLESLLKLSFVFFNSFLLVFIISTVINIFETGYLLLTLPFIMSMKSLSGFLSRNWEINMKSKKDIKWISIAFQFSLVILFFVSIF